MKAGTTRFKDHMNLNCMFSKTVGFKTAVCAVLAALVISAGVPVSAIDTEIPVKEPGYTLTPVEEPGTNTITKFEWNAEENKLTAVHYRVDLAKTEYGYKDAAGATAYYYKWVDNGNGLEFELLFLLSKHRLPMPMLPKRRTGIRLMCKSEPYLRMQGTKAGFSLSRNADNSVNSMPICAICCQNPP